MIPATIISLLNDFNDPRLTKMCELSLTSLQLFAPENYELIVIANCESNQLSNFLSIVEREDPRVRVMEFGANMGVVYKNFGYKAAKGELIFSVDSDVIVTTSSVFGKYEAYMLGHPTVGLIGPCGGHLLKEHWTPTNWPVGSYDGGKHIYGYGDPTYFGGDEDQLDGKAVDTIPSMFWCFRQAVGNMVGFLDWKFNPFVGSDSDMCFKIKETGHGVHIVRAPIVHLNNGGMSHPYIANLDAIRRDHLKELYDRWYSKLHIIAELERAAR